MMRGHWEYEPIRDIIEKPSFEKRKCKKHLVRGRRSLNVSWRISASHRNSCSHDITGLKKPDSLRKRNWCKKSPTSFQEDQFARPLLKHHWKRFPDTPLLKNLSDFKLARWQVKVTVNKSGQDFQNFVFPLFSEKKQLSLICRKKCNIQKKHERRRWKKVLANLYWGADGVIIGKASEISWFAYFVFLHCTTKGNC